MAEQPWMGDTCSLVDAFRAKELSPAEALEASLAAIEASELNAFCHLDVETARAEAAGADVTLPFGGVPAGIKELDPVEGWPYSEASLVFEGRIADRTATYLRRFREAGAVFVGQTAASEFGGINCTRTKIHGTTRNPWNTSQTPGGSSGGTAAAVAGGLVPIGTGGDGGGSIRIPCGYAGLFGLKVTYGRVPKGPPADIGALTAVLGCLTRSVRDTARFLDVVNGADTHDPLSLPRVEGYEDGLGTLDLAGLRVIVTPDLSGAAYINPAVGDLVEAAAAELVKAAGLVQVDCPAVSIGPGGMEWAAANAIGLVRTLGDRYPACADLLTPEIMMISNIASGHYSMEWAVKGESHRQELNESMASLFDAADLVITSTNPDTAFVAEGPPATVIGGVDVIAKLGFERGAFNTGALTIPGNIYGCPGVSIPIGTLDGLPVGMQVMAKHHREDLLLDLSLVAERSRPWPLVAPGAPR